jgi:hypothetical protein
MAWSEQSERQAQQNIASQFLATLSATDPGLDGHLGQGAAWRSTALDLTRKERVNSMNTTKLSNTTPLVVVDSTPLSPALKSGQGRFGASLRQVVTVLTCVFRPGLGFFFESNGSPHLLTGTPSPLPPFVSRNVYDTRGRES